VSCPRPDVGRTASSEKELGFGRCQALAGKARGEEAPQKRVYKHALERTGVRIALRAFKRVEHAFDSVWYRKVSGRRG